MQRKVIIDSIEEQLVATWDDTRLGLIYIDKAAKQTSVILLNPREVRELISLTKEIMK